MKPTDPFLSYGRQTIEEDDIEALVSAARSPFLTQGPAVAEFEKAITDRFGVKHACVMNSATAALHVAALSLGWGKGDWILTTPITFLASANCALYVGAEVDFVDIDPDTYTMSPAALERKISEMKKAGKRVKAIVGVDYAGHPCDWRVLRDIAQREGLQIIDDACHAPGALVHGTELCAAEGVSATTLSFHPVKHFTSGEGGALLTNDTELFKRAAKLRSHGIEREPSLWEHSDKNQPWYHEMQELGFNYRLPDINCALGQSQFRKLDRFNKERRRIAAFYDSNLKNDQRFIIPKVAPWAEHAYHLYSLQVRFDLLKAGRAELFSKMRDKGIGLQVLYIPIYRQPYFQKRYGYAPEAFPVAESFYARQIALPMFPSLKEADLERVVQALRELAA